MDSNYPVPRGWVQAWRLCAIIISGTRIKAPKAAHFCSRQPAIAAQRVMRYSWFRSLHRPLLCPGCVSPATWARRIERVMPSRLGGRGWWELGWLPQPDVGGDVPRRIHPTSGVPSPPRTPLVLPRVRLRICVEGMAPASCGCLSVSAKEVWSDSKSTWMEGIVQDFVFCSWLQPLQSVTTVAFQVSAYSMMRTSQRPSSQLGFDVSGW